MPREPQREKVKVQLSGPRRVRAPTGKAGVAPSGKAGIAELAAQAPVSGPRRVRVPTGKASR
jgi:hypothetical protein